MTSAQNPPRFPIHQRCEVCSGTGDLWRSLEDGEDCGACKGTGGAQCVICREPSPEVSSNGTCERCTTDAGIADTIDAECPSISDPRVPSPLECVEDVTRLRMAWTARMEWLTYRAEQRKAAAKPSPVAVWDSSIPF